MDGYLSFDGNYQLARKVNLRGSRAVQGNKSQFLKQRAEERAKRENERKRNAASTAIQDNCAQNRQFYVLQMFYKICYFYVLQMSIYKGCLAAVVTSSKPIQ